jgi:hypothetical protein
MKSHSNVRPPIFQDLGDGSWYYNFNITEVPEVTEENDESGEEKTAFEYETVQIWGNPNYIDIVKSVIREKYDESEEFALINKYNSFALGISSNVKDKEEYETYLIETSNIKAMVKKDLQTSQINTI